MPDFDVRQEQYTTVIREMIRHENEVTNHRIIWLLIGQGFLANAFVVAERASVSGLFMLSLAGILVTLSAFLMLYKSYQARGYLEFLGKQSQAGHIARGTPATSWMAEQEDQRLAEGCLGLSMVLIDPVICWNLGCSCRAFS